MEKLVKTIMEYESDTFSAQGSKIKPEEARKVADEIIAYWIDRLLDGVLIDSYLHEIRTRGL